MNPKYVKPIGLAVLIVFISLLAGVYLMITAPDFENDAVQVKWKEVSLVPGVVTVYVQDTDGKAIADLSVQVKDKDNNWKGSSGKSTDDKEGFLSFDYGETDIYGLKLNGKLIFERDEAFTLKEYGIRFYVTVKKLDL